MEELNNLGKAKNEYYEEETSALSLRFFISTFLLNWKWFVLSLIICLASAMIYLRYATPMYSVSAKFLVKDDSNSGMRSRNNAMQNMQNLGIMTNTSGFDNEVELLKSTSISREAVKDLKLYVTYNVEGRVKDHLVYKTQYVDVDLDSEHLSELKGYVKTEIECKKHGQYDVKVIYAATNNADPVKIEKTADKFPVVVSTGVGVVTMTANPKNFKSFLPGNTLKATIVNPDAMGRAYAKALSVDPSSKTTTIASLSIIDASSERASDYLKQVAEVYNRQANEDKNEIAVRTEEFINDRLKKIDSELGSTDGAIEEFKRNNNLVDIQASAQQSMASTSAYEKQLVDAETQLALLNSISGFMNQSKNKYQTLPSNVGLTDAAATSLITEYNAIVLERNRLLRSASDKNPKVIELTEQLDDLTMSIKDAMSQSRKDHEILRSSIAKQYSKYNGQISQAPQQERFLTQIGRQQEVKSSLYIMLLQKREENSISLAATANKGKLIDDPMENGKVKPRGSIIMLMALALGFVIPFLIFYLIELMRYRIEGHDDVARLTRLPIIADVAVASDTAKEKADIVVHENKNNQMEEIFRAMRTNLQFTMKEDEKVVMFTSSTSGEGKTFCAANLAVSFALLGKRVLLVGLDIRRPRLNTLFEINDKRHGITNLLVKNDVSWEDIQHQLVPSGVNNNLEILMAGPVPPNPAELCARKSLDDIFAILREQYDFIIVDTAPVGLVTDTLAIGRVVDATIYTCRADYTSRDAFTMVNQLAEEEKLPNINIIINGIDMSKKKYGYAYGYGKYGRYGRYGNYSRYGSYKYGKYGYSHYGYSSYGYGNYSSSHYGNANDNSIKQ